MNKVNSYFNSKNEQLSFGHSITNNPMDSDFKFHIHDYYELYYLISGNVSFNIEGRNYNINSGDLLIINSKELHRPCIKISSNSKEPYERIIIHFKPQYVYFLNTSNYNLCNCFEMRKLGFYNKVSKEEVQKYEIYKHIDNIEYYFNNNLKESEIMIFTIFTQMLIELNKIYFSKENPPVDSFENDNNKKIQLILNYINDNLSNKITLDMLEKEFYINKYYLCHMFKNSTGFTIQKYIIYKRLIKAKELLALGTPVLEVSAMVGFNDYSNFYRLFKKVFGISPKKA